MKLLVNVVTLSLLLAVIVSCDPIEDRDAFPSSIPASDLQFSVTQDSGNPNILYLKSTTPKSLPFWDYVVGSTNSAIDTVLIPFEGEFWIKYYAYAGGIPTVDSSRVVLEQDPTYFSDPAWALLTNNVDGKTWVWATDNASGYGVWGIGPWNASWGEWWPGAAGAAGQVGTKITDEMTFDLNKGFNYTIQAQGAAPKKSQFIFDPIARTIRLVGSGDISNGKSGVTYYIVKLTENELTLKYEDSGNGWFYLFKRKGYTYGG